VLKPTLLHHISPNSSQNDDWAYYIDSIGLSEME
jgi:hypothetical protein